MGIWAIAIAPLKTKKSLLPLLMPIAIVSVSSVVSLVGVLGCVFGVSV